MGKLLRPPMTDWRLRLFGTRDYIYCISFALPIKLVVEEKTLRLFVSFQRAVLLHHIQIDLSIV